MFNLFSRRHVHWSFTVSQTIQDQGHEHLNVILQLDVIGKDYETALERARELLPPAFKNATLEVRGVADRLPCC